MTSMLHVDGLDIDVRPHAEHEYVLETGLVAKGYGVSPEVIRRHKQNHAAELVEGKHWLRVESTGATNLNARYSGLKRGNDTITLWTKRGIVRLGFFIRSERAKRFRDAAEDLVIASTAKPVDVTDLQRLIRIGTVAMLQGKTMEQVIATIAPRVPFGTESKASGKARTKLVPSYFSSRWNMDAKTQRFLAARLYSWS